MKLMINFCGKIEAIDELTDYSLIRNHLIKKCLFMEKIMINANNDYKGI